VTLAPVTAHDAQGRNTETVRGDEQMPTTDGETPTRRINRLTDQTLFAIVVNAETDGHAERVIAPFTSAERAHDHATSGDIRRYTILPFELSYSQRRTH
jgi:hypothetical protein